MTADLLTVSDEFDIDSLRVPVKISASKECAEEHRRITNKLALAGFAPLSQPELELYLESEGIDVYPLDSVVKFMDGKIAGFPSQTYSTTRQVRSHFRRRVRTVTVRVTKKTKWRWLPIQQSTQVIPVEVLIRCEKILDDLGARVQLQVTEIYEQTTVKELKPVHADPFLCVTAPGLPLYVIERWDEPAFRR